MATVYVAQSGSRSFWADLLKVVTAPTTFELLREYRGLCGACANYVANQVSSVPYALHKGDDNEAPEVKAHLFLDTLKKPNPYMGPKILFKTTQLYLELCGRAYWKLVPGVLNPCVEIYPLQSHLVSPIMGSDNQIVAWQYDKERLTLEQVVPFYLTDPLNPYGNGKGPAELAWSEIVLMASDTALMTALMKNGGAPSYVMSPKDSQGVINPGLRERLLAMWASFRGKGANRLMIPDLPVDLKSLAQTSKEFEGSARFEQLKSIILFCFGIPSALAGSAGTRAELDSAQVQFNRMTIDPATTLLEDVVNRKILRLYGDDVNLFFDNALDEDSTDTPAEGLPSQPNPSASTVMNSEEEKPDATD